MAAGDTGHIAIDIDPDVVAKMDRGGTATSPSPDLFYNAGRSQASNFYLYGRMRHHREWVFLSDVLQSMTWNDDIEVGCVNGTVSLVNSRDPYGRRVSNMFAAGAEMRLYYAPTSLDILTVEATGGRGLIEVGRFFAWEDTLDVSGSGQTMSVRFYDQMKYLIDSEITVLFNKGKRKQGFSPVELTRAICRQQGIPLGILPKNTKGHIDYFYAEGESIFDILVKIWTLDTKETGSNYRIYFANGKLNVRRKAKKPQGKVLELSAAADGGIVLSASSTRSMEGMITSMRVWGTALEPAVGTDARRLVASASYVNKAAIAKYGRIHKELVFDGITKKSRLLKSARNNVRHKSKLTRTAQVQLVGLPHLRSGQPVRVNVDGSGIIGAHWFKAIDHSIDGTGSYSASAELRNYDYTLLLNTDADDLKPDEVEDTLDHLADIDSFAPGSGGGPVATPKEIKDYVRAAAQYAGVPASWAESAALGELISKESSFRWTVVNPAPCSAGGHATGLFQFCDKTWAGTGVQKAWALPTNMGGDGGHRPDRGGERDWKWWMMVAGLRYIKNRYRSPEGALAFHISNGWY